MSRQANISRADQMIKGRAYAQNAPVVGSKPGMLLSHTMVYRLGAGSLQGLAAPVVGTATQICLAQAIAGAADATIAGAFASGGVATMDVARTPVIVSSNAGDTTQTVTIRGTDIAGRLCQETRTLTGTTPVNFQKAFKTVIRVSVSAVMAGTLSVGCTNIFGMPARIRTGDILVAKVGNAVPEAGTVVAGDLNTPSASTGDPMGTFLSGTAPNGTNIYTYLINVEDSTENAYGQTPFYT